jgi:hypothetical protein
VALIEMGYAGDAELVNSVVQGPLIQSTASLVTILKNVFPLVHPVEYPSVIRFSHSQPLDCCFSQTCWDLLVLALVQAEL